MVLAITLGIAGAWTLMSELARPPRLDFQPIKTIRRPQLSAREWPSLLVWRMRRHPRKESILIESIVQEADPSFLMQLQQKTP